MRECEGEAATKPYFTADAGFRVTYTDSEHIFFLAIPHAGRHTYNRKRLRCENVFTPLRYISKAVCSNSHFGCIILH